MNPTHENNNKISRFVVRNSLLIDLFQNAHVKTVYHLFIATFIGLLVNTIVSDYLKKGEVILGLKLIKSGFGKIHIALLTWLGYFTSTCLVYFIFIIWAKTRNLQKINLTKLWDSMWMALLFLYYVYSFQIASLVVTTFSLPPASAAIVVLEQIRFLMKIHSFIRNTAPEVLKHPKENNINLPSFSSFFYFLWVPTLIYQRSYPRTSTIDWTFVRFRFLECIAVIFYVSFVVDRFLNPSVQDFGLRKYTIQEIIISIFENTVAGIFILLPLFFLLLHSWQNLFGEITRFGDRLFYSDWWTSTDFSGYFRKWNIIVQQWLFIYVYKDFKEHVLPSPNLAKFAVFLISAVVHEWVLTYMFGFFFPLLFIEFLVFGSILTVLGAPKTAPFNVLFWYSLALGVGSLVTMYGLELYARKHVPIVNNTFWNTVLPRFITCDCIE